MKRITLLIFIASLTCSTLSARHIIGGLITYECLGGGDYEFTMKVYRDCLCNNCADFDIQASIAIYRCGGSTNCNILTQNSPIHEFFVGPPMVDRVPNSDFPCLIPPDVCVQEGVYRWRLSELSTPISLPSTNDSYHIVYQRCCRNETIDNLNRPDDQGATFSVEITPFSQSECNSSPDYDLFPPTIVCAGSSIDFDHGATDPDGDSIVYQFCTPLQGGGNILNGPEFNSCVGALPDPPCPPPFNSVNYLPPFTAAQPMGGNPIVTIDPNTGFISGVPELQGQFVVGVCATEFRDGRPIGRITRDFQFNVGNCDPTVEGVVEADEVIGQDTFLIRLCGEMETTIVNRSFQERFIESFQWTFDIDGQIQTFDEWSPLVSFPDTGVYFGNLLLNPGEDCGDTSTVIVTVFPAVNAGFDFTFDTCVAGPVEFTNNTTALGGPIVEWNWQFGDGEVSSERDPTHLYRIPGRLPVTLRATDPNGCVGVSTQFVDYFPVPNLIVISPSSADGCQPLEVFFDNLSFPIDETYDINWDFGDGGTSTEISPTYIYEDIGTFTVSVDITSPIGCQTDTTFNDLINVDGSPTAAFDFSPQDVTSFNRVVEFTNLSQNEASVVWDFDGTFRTIQPNPTFTFRDTGVHVITLIAIHQSGCRDTVSTRIDVEPKVTYFLPNAFTPNNDSNNDTYKGVGFFEGISGFEMNIWNRWGEKIFETTDPNQGWNGLKNNVGLPAPNGVYVVTVKYVDPRGTPFELEGIATVVR